jgi:DNA invertase Pin-like site-specific DNA recombinase
MMLDAYIYCRVSSKKQLENGHGNESQEQTCREYCARQGYRVVRVFAERGVSGGLAIRPIFEELLVTLRQRKGGNQAIVVVDDMKRFSRSVEGHFLLKKKLYKLNAKLETPSIRIEDTPSGKFIETIIAGAAELEREENRLQVLRRMKARLMSGYWCFPDVPPGYAYRKQGKNKVIVATSVSALYCRVLEGYARGETQASLARFLEQELRHKVYVEHISRVLERSLFFAGYLAYPKWEVGITKANHPAIISFATHQKIQQRIAGATRVYHRQNVRPDFPLRGFTKCECQVPLTAGYSHGRSKTYPYYYCRNNECPAYGKSIKQAQIEGDFTKLLKNLKASPEMVRAAELRITRRYDNNMTLFTEQQRERERECISLKKKIKNLALRAASAKPTTADTYETEIETMQEQIIALKEGKSEIPDFPFRTVLNEVLKIVSNPDIAWQEGDFSKQCLVLKTVFSGHVVYTKNQGFRTPELSLCYEYLSGYQQAKSVVSGHGENRTRV